MAHIEFTYATTAPSAALCGAALRGDVDKVRGLLSLGTWRRSILAQHALDAHTYRGGKGEACRREAKAKRS